MIAFEDIDGVAMKVSKRIVRSVGGVLCQRFCKLLKVVGLFSEATVDK